MGEGAPPRTDPHLLTDVRSSVGELGPAWDALVDASPRPSPFLCAWWLEAVAAGTPTFVIVFEDGNLIGGLPLTVDRRRAVRRYRMVTAGIEHGLDLVAAPGREDAVAGAVRAWLDRPGDRLVNLIGVRPDGALVGCAPTTARVDKLESAPWFEVPPTFDDYLASRPRKLRQEIRRVLRRLDEAGVRYRVVDDSDAERALANFERLHRQRWGARSVFLASLGPFAAAARAGAARGEVRFHEVVVAGEVIASLVTIERWGCCYFVQMGRNPDARWSNSGTLLKAKAIERACGRGFVKVDLCSGDPQSKAIWADEREQVARVHWGHGAGGRFVDAALVALWPAADAVRRLRMRVGTRVTAR
jgi:CelD/BcsL family acetyltransferase involved in cellulose biosynthesis